MIYSHFKVYYLTKCNHAEDFFYLACFLRIIGLITVVIIIDKKHKQLWELYRRL